MTKILDAILEIEDDAKAQVGEAQKKARESKENAEKENTERVNAARAEAATSLLATISKTKKEWDEKYRQTILSQDSSHADFLNTKAQEIESVAAKIAAIIQTPRYKIFNE